MIRSTARRGAACPALRLVLAAAVALAATSGAAVARADVTAEQRASAQVLFDDARKLIGEKRWSEACPKLEESQRIDPGLGTLLNLAECQAQIGKTASAWANFLEAAYQAKAANQTKREMTARAKAAALEPRLSRLTVTAPVGVEVWRDGALLTSSALGTPFPVDPGEHVVAAAAPGKKRWEQRVTVKDNGDRVSVGVPPLEPEPPPPPPPPPVTSPDPAKAPPPPPPVAPPVETKPPPPPPEPPEPPDTGAPARRIGGAILLIAGAGGLGTGVGYVVLAKSRYDQSTQDCLKQMPNVCHPYGAGLRDDARRDGDIATVALIAGGVVAVGGLSLLLSSIPPSKPSPSGVASKPSPAGIVVTPTAGLDPRGGGMLGLSGRF